jgi:hypothetical protein
MKNALERRLASAVGRVVTDGTLLNMLAKRKIIVKDDNTNSVVWFWGRPVGVCRYIDRVLQSTVDTGVNVYNVSAKYISGCFSPFVHITLQRKSEAA